MKGKVSLEKWECSHCHAEQTVDKARCGTCKYWRGGKRVASKKWENLKSTPNNMEAPPKYFGRKPKNMPTITVAITGDNDALSPLTPPVPKIHEKSFE